MPNFSTRTTRIGTQILVSTLALAAANAANAQVTGGGGGNSYVAGDPVVVSGNVTFDRTGTANTETYTINSNTAVLDFIPTETPPGGPINFQLAGTLVQYLGGLGITDFTVLNRILATDPSRAIQLNGTIISRLQASPTTPGGSVWFYSPSGIIVGSTAVIDVGNLLLATGDPTGGTGVISNPNQFTINSVADSNAAITVQAGAQITASNPGSYIALVAPAIAQSGTVNTNGSAAYVAAEQTTLTFNSGLFNIQTAVGSNANNNTPLVHDGTTRFIDDTGLRRAYLVSVAKNDAITMLIGGAGQLGFDTATGVNIDNGTVVLSGGYDVTDTTHTNLAGTAGALRHDIQITSPTNNANFRGQVNPFAASEIRINALGQAMTFAGNVSMNAGSLASIVAGTSGSVDIAGDLDLSTLVYGTRDANITGGNVVVDASFGNISIGGNTSLTSFVNADLLGGLDPAGTVQGGTVLIIANNGNAVNMLGNLDVQVEANGADQLLTSQTSAGNAIGGNVFLVSSGISSLSVGGATNIKNSATGGSVQLGNATAGNATGGIVDILAGDGSIVFGGDLSVSARANGGQVNASGTTAAGDGTGGQINFSVGSGNLSVAGNLGAEATGFGGSTEFATSRDGGDGFGGTINLSSSNSGGLLSVTGDTLLTVDGQGSDGRATGNGGNSTGGTIAINLIGGSMAFANLTGKANAILTSGNDNSGVVATAGTIGLLASGGNATIGGNLRFDAISGSFGLAAGQDGASGIGGNITIVSGTGGLIDIAGEMRASAQGVGGETNGGLTRQAGAGTGGTVVVQAFDGGQMNIGNGTVLDANAVGGGVAGSTGRFGEATAGRVLLQAALGGQINITGTVDLSANAFAGSTASTNPGIFGANSTGGLVQLLANDGNAVININGDVNMLATATGSVDNGGNGVGGTGTGGSIDLNGANGTGNVINIAGNFHENVSGFGGASLDGTGGAGIGGFATFGALSGADTSLSGSANILAEGVGGTGLNGGAGTGGRAVIFANSAGSTNIGSQVSMRAHGFGGQGDGAGHAGGIGQGGRAEIFAQGTINIAGDYDARSGGIGGNGANGADGGDAFGGVGSIIADGGAINLGRSAVVRGSTFGGNIVSGTGSGGNAQGGLAQMIARNGGSLQILGTGQAGTLDANVATSAFGGDGLSGSGSGGNGIGGTSNVFAESGGTIAIAGGLLATASGFGGNAFFDPSNQYADLGGNGIGGTVNIFTNGGTIIGTSSVAAFANGQGGFGVVQGGMGTGGTINIQAIDGLMDFSSGSGIMKLSTTGFGGNAVTEADDAGNIVRGGGSGGDGIGGTLLVLAGVNGNGNGSTGILRTGDIVIAENAAAPLGIGGIGGAGAEGAAGQDGGDGGDGVAGVVRIGTNNGSSQFTAGNITVGNRAIGGIGGDGKNGGAGGDAAGRQTAIGTFNEIGTNTGGFMTVGNININGSALGGNGGAGLNGTGGIGGNSLVGPPALLSSQASAYLVARPNIFTFGDAVLTMDSTGGDGGTGTSGRAAGGTAAGFGTAIITTEAADGVGFGQVVGNSFVGQAISTGGLGAGDVRAASNRGFSLLSAVGGGISLANATLIDGGLAAHQNGIFSAIESGNGFVLVTGLVDVDVDGDFGLLGYAGGDIDMENLNVVAGGTIIFDDPNAPGSTIPDAITVNQNATAVLGGDFTIDSDIEIGGVFDLTAGGAINTLGITAGAGIRLQGGSTITTGNLLSIGDISLIGLADEILGLPASILTGNITSQAGLINVVTNIGDITLGNLTSPNAISIDAGNGSTNANAGGDIVVGTVQGSSLSILGTDNLTIGAIEATQSINVATTGLASFNGIANAPIIAVTSGDINFGANGGLGGTNTDDLEINARAPDQPIIFGGDGSGGGYNLSASEATKLRSRTIRFNAQQVSGAAPADITIRDFTMQGSLAGSNANLLASDLFINSSGNIRVTGAVRIENAGAGDSLFLSANAGRIEVVTDMGGSIAIVDDAGGLGGNLYLDANHIAVGKSDLLARLADDPRFAGRDAEVNAPDGSNRPEGYISANRIQAGGFETIIIQNSGTDALRGGFSAGTGGFVLHSVLQSDNMTAGAVDAVINGRVANGSGGFLTNDDTLSGVTIEPPADAALFSAGSTINGCLLNGGGCPIVNPPSPSEETTATIASTVREVIHEENGNKQTEEEEERAAELTPAATGKKSPIAPNIPVVNTTRLSSSPTVTDPITGSGNPNLIGGELEIDPDPSPGATNDGDF